MREERRTFWSTHIGPVIYRSGNRIFTILSTRLDAFQYFEGFYDLSKARDLDEWNSAMRRNLVPTSVVEPWVSRIAGSATYDPDASSYAGLMDRIARSGADSQTKLIQLASPAPAISMSATSR